MKFLKDLLYVIAVIGIIMLLAVSIAYIWKSVRDNDFEAGSTYDTPPIAIVGILPTSTITFYNSVYYATSTATTTEYAIFGPEIDEIYMNLWAYSTTSDANTIGYMVETNPRLNRPTSTLDFFGFDSPSSSSGLITHNTGTTTHQWSIPSVGQYAKQVLICSNYDGTDDVPSCPGGWYKFIISNMHIVDSGIDPIEIYAEVFGIAKD